MDGAGKIYADALISLPFKLFLLNQDFSNQEANKLLHSRIESLLPSELSDVLAIVANFQAAKYNSRSAKKYMYLCKTNLSAFLGIEGNDKLIAAETLRSRLHFLTELEVVNLIANLNGRIGSIEVKRIQDAQLNDRS